MLKEKGFYNQTASHFYYVIAEYIFAYISVLQGSVTEEAIA